MVLKFEILALLDFVLLILVDIISVYNHFFVCLQGPPGPPGPMGPVGQPGAAVSVD